MQLPEGWQLITREFPFQLGPGKREVRLVSFFVPLTALAGRYQLTYSVKDRRDYGVSDEDRVEIVVLPVARLEIIKEEIPRSVIAGEEYQARFLITNLSNARSRIALDIKSSAGYPARADISEFLLAPGARQKVTLTVQTNKEIRKKVSHRLTVTAMALDLKNGEVTAATSVVVEVIPRITGVKERYHRVPGWLKVIGAGEGGKSGIQFEFSGSGTLDEEGSKRIDFLFRGPDVQETSIFGLRDEYRLSLQSERAEIHIGDRGYSLSPLTEQHRYGRGAEAALKLKRLRLGGFYLKTRRQRPEEKEWGGYLGYQFNQRLRLDLNFLNKQREGTADANLWSIQLLAEPIESLSMELEYGLGREKRAGVKKTDNAWRAKIRGDIKGKVIYFFQKIHAGSDYPGYY